MNEKKPKTLEEIKVTNSIRVRRNISFLLAILFVPTTGTIHKLTGSDVFSITIGLVIFFTTGGLWLWLAFAKCPRCKKTFFTSWYSNGFSKKCLNCGLSLKKM